MSLSHRCSKVRDRFCAQVARSIRSNGIGHKQQQRQHIGSAKSLFPRGLSSSSPSSSLGSGRAATYVAVNYRADCHRQRRVLSSPGGDARLEENPRRRGSDYGRADDKKGGDSNAAAAAAAAVGGNVILVDDDGAVVGDLLVRPDVADVDSGDCPGARDDLIGRTSRIRRTFHSQCNAQAMLVCGGETLATHASFDPKYNRAVSWIRHRAVGTATLSPVLLTGLIGALVEASFPQSVHVSQSIRQHHPLIVGVPIEAEIEVVGVIDRGTRQGSREGTQPREGEDDQDQQHRQQQKDVRVASHELLGYQVELETRVCRVQDGTVIADGMQRVWVPDFK